MTHDSIRAFVNENFGKDYFPVYHGQTNIVTPLALIVKQKRKWWKRPFGKAEMIILGGLESYIVDEKKNHFHNSSESKLVTESKSMEKTKTGEVSRYVLYAQGGDSCVKRTGGLRCLLQLMYIMYMCMRMCILNWPLPIGAFQDQYKQTMINKYSNKHNYVKNPNWQEATSWLFKSAAEKLNSGLPRTASSSGQNGI